MTRDGTILFCSMYNDVGVNVKVPNKNKILHNTFSYVKIPLAIAVCEKQMKVYISELHRNNPCHINVFNFE